MARGVKCLAGVRTADMAGGPLLRCNTTLYSPHDPCQIRGEIAALPPSSVAPHPLLGSLADPGLELLLHFGRDPLHVVGLVGRARHLELLQLDLEAALLAHAQAARHPDASAE